MIKKIILDGKTDCKLFQVWDNAFKIVGLF